LPQFNLSGVWGSGPGDVFVVGRDLSGAHAIVRHWDGAQWAGMTVPDAAGGDTIWGSSSNDVYVNGSTGGAQLLHWDGRRWSPLGIQVADGSKPPNYILKIWGKGAKDVYTNGDSLFHWDGNVWSRVGPTGGNRGALWANTRDDLYVANVDGVWHWDGRDWATIYSDIGFINDIWSDGAGAFYFVSSTAVLTPTTATWTNAGLWSIDTWMWGIGEEVFCAHEALGRVSFAPGETVPPAVLEGLPGSGRGPGWIWGLGPDDIWGVNRASLTQKSDNHVFHWDGSNWTAARTSWIPWSPNSTGTGAGGASTSGAPFGLNAIGGASSSDLWAVGDVVAHWDGTIWGNPMPAGASLASVWARSASDVYAVGAGGYIQHWDGTAWSQMSSGTTRDLHDVWGTPLDVFAVGDDGVMLRLGADKSWVSMRTPVSSQSLELVRASGPGNVFATSGPKDLTAAERGGAPAMLLHLRGGAWEQITLPSMQVTPDNSPVAIPALWVTPTAVYIATTFGLRGRFFFYRLNLTGVDCQAPERNCNDGWDNDCDGLQDGDDPDCKGQVTEICANLADDDGDGLIDCADPDCAQFPSCRRHK
jgi:hypothetical protein